MPFNLTDFRSQMVGDGARPNLFEVIIKPATISGAIPENTKFFIKSAQLPGSTIGTVPVFYFGREVKFAGNRTFPEWTVTVINDENFVVRNLFESWMNRINTHAGNVRQSASVSIQNQYVADLEVLQYGKTNPGRELKKYKFVGAFPTDVSAIDLDWGSNDTIEEFTVTFSYQWWESDTTDTSGSIQTTLPGTLTA